MYELDQIFSVQGVNDLPVAISIVVFFLLPINRFLIILIILESQPFDQSVRNTVFGFVESCFLHGQLLAEHKTHLHCPGLESIVTVTELLNSPITYPWGSFLLSQIRDVKLSHFRNDFPTYEAFPYLLTTVKLDHTFCPHRLK